MNPAGQLRSSGGPAAKGGGSGGGGWEAGMQAQAVGFLETFSLPVFTQQFIPEPGTQMAAVQPLEMLQLLQHCCFVVAGT